MTTVRTITAQPDITAMETKVAVNGMTRMALMESPGPEDAVTRGFLVQRNHESGGIVIAYSLPERSDSGNGAISTFCNRDISAIAGDRPISSEDTELVRIVIDEGFPSKSFSLGFAEAALVVEHESIDVVLVDPVANAARRSAQDRCKIPAKFL
jgi:hypothetical protein